MEKSTVCVTRWLLMFSRCLYVEYHRLLSCSTVFQMSELHRFITSVMWLGETRLFRWINGVIHINFWLIVLIYCADRIVFLLPWPQSSTSFVTTVMTLRSIFSSLASLLLLLQWFCEKPISRFKFPFKKKKKEKHIHNKKSEKLYSPGTAVPELFLFRQSFKLPCLIAMAFLIKSQGYVVVCEGRLICSCLHLSQF